VWYLTALGRCCAGRWRRRRARTPLRRACATALNPVLHCSRLRTERGSCGSPELPCTFGREHMLQAVPTGALVSANSQHAAAASSGAASAPGGAHSLARAAARTGAPTPRWGQTTCDRALCAFSAAGACRRGRACDSCERAPRRRRRRLLPGGGYAGRGSRHSAPAAWLRALHSTKAQDAGGGPEDS